MGHGAPGYDYRLRHIVFHKLSPFELSPFRTTMQLARTLPDRIKRNFWPVPLYVAFYIITDHWENVEREVDRKKPETYANDV